VFQSPPPDFSEEFSVKGAESDDPCISETTCRESLWKRRVTEAGGSHYSCAGGTCSFCVALARRSTSWGRRLIKSTASRWMEPPIRPESRSADRFAYFALNGRQTRPFHPLGRFTLDVLLAAGAQVVLLLTRYAPGQQLSRVFQWQTTFMLSEGSAPLRLIPLVSFRPSPPHVIRTWGRT
jgi:hypothetical protein